MTNRLLLLPCFSNKRFSLQRILSIPARIYHPSDPWRYDDINACVSRVQDLSDAHWRVSFGSPSRPFLALLDESTGTASQVLTTPGIGKCYSIPSNLKPQGQRDVSIRDSGSPAATEIMAAGRGLCSIGLIGDVQRKANTVFCFARFHEEQSSQIGIPQKFAIGFVGSSGPASCLALLG